MDLERIWDVLKRCCGARDYWRENFLQVAGEHRTEGRVLEYRFQGALGFGGKVWLFDGEPRVSCYKEDETPARRDMIAAANAELKAMG